MLAVDVFMRFHFLLEPARQVQNFVIQDLTPVFQSSRALDRARHSPGGGANGLGGAAAGVE